MQPTASRNRFCILFVLALPAVAPAQTAGPVQRRQQQELQRQQERERALRKNVIRTASETISGRFFSFSFGVLAIAGVCVVKMSLTPFPFRQVCVL